MTVTVQQFIESTYNGKWAGDARHGLKVGEVGFLLELTPIPGPSAHPNFKPRKRLEIRPHPGRLAGTLEEMLYGVIQGDRTDVECLGVAKVTEVAPNGRGRVETLWGDAARDALEILAYPDLGDELDIANEPYDA
jgi:hypothetical protein